MKNKVNKKYKGVEVYSGYNEMSFCNEDGVVKSWVSDKDIKELGEDISKELYSDCVKWLVNDGTDEEEASEYASEWIDSEMNNVLSKDEICVGFSEESFYFIVSEDSKWFNKVEEENEELSEFLANIDW
jgi:hypothetical protein